MTDQLILNIVAVAIGGGLMLAFHLRSKKMRSLTPHDRKKYQDERERWLNGKSWGARFYKLLIAFLLLCTCAHVTLTVWMKHDLRDKHHAADGKVILDVYKKYACSADNVYEIEFFNGTSADVWVPPQLHVVSTGNTNGMDTVVLNDYKSEVVMSRIKPRNTMYFKLAISSTNRPVRVSAIYYDMPLKGVQRYSQLLLW